MDRKQAEEQVRNKVEAQIKEVVIYINRKIKKAVKKGKTSIWFNKHFFTPMVKKNAVVS